MKRIKILLIITLALSLLLSSCSIEEKVADYSNEAVIGSAAENTAVISELSDIIYALTVDSVKLPEFNNTSTAISKCGDALLNHLLTTNYSRFSGSTAILKEASKEYPHLSISAAIGERDFEGALYKYFNHGGNIRHGDLSRFRYLPKIEAYIPAVRSIANTFDLDIAYLEETNNTYRMTFYCTNGEDVSPEYYAVFVKRQNGGCYIQSLKQVASEKVSYVLPEAFS